VNPFLSLRDYEEFVYTLQHSYPIIKGSSLVVIQRGKYIAVLQGDLIFAHGYRISIKERLSDDSFVKIEDYGYEFWYHSEKIAWYDSQPHPGDPTLASTHPHHKHAPPNIKHNRIPAKNMRFTQPNLPALIQDVEDLINQLINESQPKE
jgi:hypothetical protein